MNRVEEVAPEEEEPVEEEEEEMEDPAPEGKAPGEGTDKEDDEQSGAAGASTDNAPARAP